MPGGWLPLLRKRRVSHEASAGQVLAALSEAAVITDADFLVRGWNRAFAERSGSMAALLGSAPPLADVLRGWAADGLLDADSLPAALATLKTAVDGDYAITLAGLHYRVRQSRLDTGGLMLVLRDESTKYELTQALARTEQHCAALFEHAPAGLVMSSTADGGFVRLNTRAREQLGIGPHVDMQALRARDFYACAADLEEVESGLRMRGEVNDKLVPLRRADGAEIWASLSARKVILGERGFVLSILADVTRMRSEAQHSRRDSDRLEQLIELAPTAILLTRAEDGVILLHNRRTRELLNDPAFGLVGRSALEFYVEREAREHLVAAVRRDGHIDRHAVLLRPPGSAQDRWFELSAVAVEYDGSPALLTSLHDIDSLHTLEAQLAAARAEADQARARARELSAELDRLAAYDRLTQALNRRHFEEVAARELGRARRYSLSLAVLMFDIDHFRHINDDYGRVVGDGVLRELVGLLRTRLRVSDVLARWGGEEFVVLAPSTSLEEARRFAEKLRDLIAAHPFPEVGEVSVSVGVTALDYRDTLDNLLRRADQALHRAKAEGRNRVMAVAS